jgi:septal ring factor EnvC (AmiA/AmiB activator)
MPDLMGTVPQWISAAALVSLLGVIFKYRLGVKQLINVDTADIRDHYAEELKRKTDEIERVEQRQHACEAREQALRERVRELEDELAGIKRAIAQYSADRMIVLEDRPRPPSETTPDAAASAPRVKRIVEAGGK